MIKRSEFLKKVAVGSMAATGLSNFFSGQAGTADHLSGAQATGSQQGVADNPGAVTGSGSPHGDTLPRAQHPSPGANDPVTFRRDLIFPKRLQPGDTVAFSAPAGIIYDRSDFVRMEKAMDNFGLKVRFGEYVRERYGYFSGSDLQRAMDLNRFFVDASVDAIIAVRGGWGSARILPHLNFNSIKTHPKIFCGFSDITTLHLAIQKECDLVTFHGPNGASEWSDLTKKSFKEVLMDGAKAEFISNGYVRTITPGSADGPLIGGNLTILATSLGTPYQPDCTGAILFLEDIGEPVYKIDRMLTHLKRAGILNVINGFIFGDCNECPRPRSDHFTLEEIIRQHIEPLGIPAMSGADISHGDDNFTIPMGILARMDADGGVFELLEKAVCDDRRSQISD